MFSFILYIVELLVDSLSGIIIRKLHEYIPEEIRVSLFSFLILSLILTMNIPLLEQKYIKKNMKWNNAGILSNEQDMFIRKFPSIIKIYICLCIPEFIFVNNFANNYSIRR